LCCVQTIRFDGHIGAKRLQTPSWSQSLGTHSIRRARLTLIYRKTGNIRACQIMLGHKTIASTQLYLGVEEEETLDPARHFQMDQDDKFFEIAVNRAQSWYNLLAEQRMRLMNFYVVILAASAALAGSMNGGLVSPLALLSGLGLTVISIVFKLLDRRTSEMIKVAEKALSILEKLCMLKLELKKCY
jgi:hypothetical protein